MKKYGVPEEEIFQTADLFERRNIPQVTLCIYALARLVSTQYRSSRFFILSRDRALMAHPLACVVRGWIAVFSSPFSSTNLCEFWLAQLFLSISSSSASSVPLLRPLFLFCVLCFQLVTPIFLKSFLTSSSHLTLGLPFGLVAYGFHLCMGIAVLLPEILVSLQTVKLFGTSKCYCRFVCRT